MTCIVLKHSNVLYYAFIVSALHIYVTLSYNIDYEYPYNIFEDYDDYFTHRPLRYDTRKLSVDDYYFSVYNPFDRRMPLINEISYDIYSQRYLTMTKMEANSIQKNVSKNTTIIEEKYLDRKIYDKDRSYHTTKPEYYEMNKNFIRVVAIKRMIEIMSLSGSSEAGFDGQIIKAIQEQAKETPPPAKACNSAFMSFQFGKKRSTETEQKKLPLESFRENYNKSDYAATSTIDVLSKEQYLKIRSLMVLFPSNDDDVTSYKEKYTSLLKFIGENFKNMTQPPIKIDEKLSNERIEALRSKHPLKSETYNFYLVRSKVYGFIPFHFKFCQDHFNVFKNENEEELSSLFGIPKHELKSIN